jgi:hypothetical protein
MAVWWVPNRQRQRQPFGDIYKSCRSAGRNTEHTFWYLWELYTSTNSLQFVNIQISIDSEQQLICLRHAQNLICCFRWAEKADRYNQSLFMKQLNNSHICQPCVASIAVLIKRNRIDVKVRRLCIYSHILLLFISTLRYKCGDECQKANLSIVINIYTDDELQVQLKLGLHWFWWGIFPFLRTSSRLLMICVTVLVFNRRPFIWYMIFF